MYLHTLTLKSVEVRIDMATKPIPVRPCRPRPEFNGEKLIKLGAGVGEIWIFSVGAGDAYTCLAPALLNLIILINFNILLLFRNIFIIF